jgi:hypothetical protein
MIALLVFASVSMADIILFDQAPGTTGGTRAPAATPSGYTNHTDSQNFADLMVLTGNETLTGMDIYSSNLFPSLGGAVTVRIRATPAGAILHELTSVISTIDSDGVGAFANTVRVHADFAAPLALAAGSYYIGMSGVPDITQLAIVGGAGPHLDGLIGLYSGTVFAGQAGVGDQAFRVWGVSSAPEPSMFVLLGVAAGALVLRRRRKAS